jgi:hypothetical protein
VVGLDPGRAAELHRQAGCPLRPLHTFDTSLLDELIDALEATIRKPIINPASLSTEDGRLSVIYAQAQVDLVANIRAAIAKQREEVAESARSGTWTS